MGKFDEVYKKAICIEKKEVKINGDPSEDMYFQFRLYEEYEYKIVSINDNQIYFEGYTKNDL